MITREHATVPITQSPFSFSDSALPAPLRGKLSGALVLALLMLLAAQLYAPSLTGDWFADDFPFIVENPSDHLLRYFVEPNAHGYYRPIEAGLLALSQLLFGTETMAVHVLVLSLHVTLAGLVFRTILDLGHSRLQAITGALFMLVSQSSVYAVSGLDTISQVMGTACGCGSLWMLYHALDGFGESRDERASFSPIKCRSYAASLLLLALSLWSKESSLGFSGMAILLLAVGWRAGGYRHKVRWLLRAAPIAALSAFYLFSWFMVASDRLAVGAGRGKLSLGSNLVSNLAKFVAAAASPISTVDVFLAQRTGQHAVLLLTGLLIVVFLGAVAIGLWRHAHRGTAAVMLALLLCATFPAVLMNHVSELHAYNLIPFMSVLVGIGLGGGWLHGKEPRSVSLPGALLVATLLLQHALVVRTKSTSVADNGARAQLLLQQVTERATEMPAGGVLVLVNPKAASPSYSVYQVHGFNVLSPHVQRLVRMRIRRPDIRILVRQSYEPVNLGLDAAEPHELLTLRGPTEVVPLSLPPEPDRNALNRPPQQRPEASAKGG